MFLVFWFLLEHLGEVPVQTWQLSCRKSWMGPRNMQQREHPRAFNLFVPRFLETLDTQRLDVPFECKFHTSFHIATVLRGPRFMSFHVVSPRVTSSPFVSPPFHIIVQQCRHAKGGMIHRWHAHGAAVQHDEISQKIAVQHPRYL